MKASIIVPTYNAGRHFQTLFTKIEENAQALAMETEIIVVDSSSNDGSIDFLKNKSVRLISIPQSEFNHGGTRNMAAEQANGDVLIYMTQDADPASGRAMEQLIAPLLSNKDIGMAYGRQLPRPDADLLARLARDFNYPPQSTIKSLADVPVLGFKTIFASNSFAAYKKEALQRVGGFPRHTIFGEDTYVAAKMILEEYSVAYVADAEVFHSHNYTNIEEFHRYFDIGVFHSQEKWLLDTFSAPESEGIKFLKRQIKYASNHGEKWLIPNIIVRNGLKYIGYRLGLKERLLPAGLKKRFSMQRRFWS
ncbi:MAG: glycosyltransferase [Sporolactobacillus sp.]